MTKKWVKFKTKINKRLNQAAEWWGVKQKISVGLYQKTPYAITSYSVTPYLVEKDKAKVCIFTDAWKYMDEVEEWYFCYHEVGHIKFWCDGYPIPVLEADEVDYPSFLNSVRVFSEQIILKYSEFALPLLKDLFERHMDYLVDSTLALAFKPEMLETLRWQIQREHAREPMVPPAYHAFLVAIDNAGFSRFYDLTKLSDKEIEERILEKILSLHKDLPNAKEIFERAKGILSQVRFTSDTNTIIKWILDMHSLMPDIDFKSS
jgi:hypothetical protein